MRCQFLEVTPVTRPVISRVRRAGGRHSVNIMLKLVASPLRSAPPAAPLLEVANAVNITLGGMPLIHTSLVLAAWRGQEARVAELGAAGIQDASPAAEARAVALAQYARAVLSNGLSRYDLARAAAQGACESADQGLLSSALPELIEASARSGRPETTASALRQLECHVPAGDPERALGIRAQSRALASADEGAEALYEEALERLLGCDLPLHLARAQLLYGEWLRRQGCRVRARGQLRAAEATFTHIGATGFAERGRRELLATGETVRRRSVETRDDLTPQEAHIAAFAGRGYTNSEIGAQLFLSPRTIEWHLHKVFIKLGLSSRRELREAS